MVREDHPARANLDERSTDGLQLSQAWDVSWSGEDCGEKKARGERSRRRAGGGVDMAAGKRHTTAQDRGGTDSDESE